MIAPTYRIDRSFEWNADNGPCFGTPIPSVPPTPGKMFFGYEVNSRFGLAAGLGMRAPWIELYARLGFDILTYKTVRSRAKLAAPLPNWLFANDELRATSEWPADPAHGTAFGSIAMPSSDPAIWRPDIARARAALGPGQVLIVSIVATAEACNDPDAFVAEFAALAAEVVAAGAQIVEANLSCPNVASAEGEVYLDPQLAGRIARAVKHAGCPVLLKIGADADDATLAALLHEVNGAADGVVMVNAPARLVVDGAGEPAFGPGRVRAGLMGRALHPIALDCVRRAVGIVQRDGLALQIVGVGGVSTPGHARAFLDAGACAALSGSAASWNPFMAIEVKRADATL